MIQFFNFFKGMKMTNFYDSLNELVTDSRFRSLAVTQNFESFLGVDGINESENMKTFGWLLNPKGSHGLHDIFLKELFTTTWSMLHGQATTRPIKGMNFYSKLSPITFQNASFAHTFVDQNINKEVVGADMVITDITSKIMLVINNRYSKSACDKVVSHFSSDKYKYFENKIFLSFDGEVQGTKDCTWMYMSNEWLINLCTNIIECPQYSNARVTGCLKDFYQFLTGSQYGVTHEHLAEYSASIISDYYDVISALKTFKAEKVNNVALIDINPRDYASLYFGKISEQEYGILSLFWSYKNTFNTFFQLAELEEVTRNLDKSVEGKSFGFNRTFIRNGLCFTPSFEKIKGDRTFINRIFDVEMTLDLNKNLSLGLVVNKDAWDRLNHSQRESVQKNFDFSSVLLNDRVMVWNRFYKEEWNKQDLAKEIISTFEKVDMYIGKIGMRVA
jgi:hypothetical protein